MKIRNRIVLVVAAVSLSIAAASPANAACAAGGSTASGDTSISGFATTASVNPAPVTPNAIQWNLFENNIGSSAKCQALLTKMKAAYPASYHWMCQSYQAQVCPAQTRWALWFGENNI